MSFCPDLTDSSSTTTPNPQALAQLQQAWGQVSDAASTPYKPYQRQLVAPLNSGQTTAIGQLQGTYGMAQPYIDAGAGQMSGASASLGNVNNYLKASSGALGQVQGYMNQASQYATPQNFDPSAYMNPYQQSVIDTTMAWAKQNDAAQMASLVSNSIGNGAYGGDRNGIAVGTIAGQQAMANDSTVANLNAQNYAQATAQWNQMQADRYQSAGIYQNLGAMAGQSAQQYGALGQLQQQTGVAQGNLGNSMAGLGQMAQGQAIAGASSALQGSTLQQQMQQQQDAARYAQFQQRQSYPFQTAGFLANIANGQAANMGSTATQQGSILSSLVGAGALGLGIMNTSSGISNNILPNWGRMNASGQANGGRVGYAGGGNIGLAAAMRPHFDDGGILFNPTAAGLPYTANNNLTAANPLWGSVSSSGGGAGGAGGPGVARLPSQSQSGIGALVTSPTALASSAPATSSTSGGGDSSSDDSGGLMSRNASMGLMAAGLAMMGGTGSGISNIGRGGLEGLQTYLGLQQQDQNNAYRQQQFGVENRKVDISQSEVDARLKQLDAEREYHQGQLNVEQKNALTQQTNATTQQKNTESEIAARRAGLISMVPGFDNNGNPVMYRIDRGNPDNPYSVVTPPGQNSTTSSPSVTPSAPSPAPVPIPAASPDPALQAAPSVPAASPAADSGPTAPATKPQVPAAAPTPSQTGVMVWQPTKAPPPGYVPPNQMQISFDPDVKKQQGELGSKIVGESRETYQKAANSQMQLSEMNHSIDNLPRSGVLAPGSFGDERAKFAQAANTIATTLGGQPVFDPNKIADSEELKKDAFRLGSQMLANTNGGREAGFIIKSSVGATPSMNNTYAGFKRVSAGLEQANQYAMDRAEFMDNYYSKFGHVSGAEAAFQKLNPWQNYSNRAIVGSVDPRDVSALQQNAKNPAAFQAIDNKYGAGVSKLILGSN